MGHTEYWKFFLLGAGSGGFKILLQINSDVPFGVKLFQAGLTALLCGFLGMAGKWLFDFIKNKFTKSKVKNNVGENQ